jgi:hypothetical protein
MTDAQAPPLCSRCHQAPRLTRQRWCRTCLTAYKRDRRARLQARGTGADGPTSGQAEEAVTHAPLLPETPLVLCFRCGYSQWREHVPGLWVCGLCGIPPAVHHP